MRIMLPSSLALLVVLTSFAVAGEPSLARQPFETPPCACPIDLTPAEMDIGDMTLPLTPPTNAEPDPTGDTLADEILRLRELVGEHPLEGRRAFHPLPLDAAADDDFPPPPTEDYDRQVMRQAIRRLARRDAHVERPQIELVNGDECPFGVCPLREMGPARTAHDGRHPHAHPHETLTSEASPVAVESLREASFQLDQIVHLLESNELYEQSDAVRRVSDMLRYEARERRRHAPGSRVTRLPHYHGPGDWQP